MSSILVVEDEPSTQKILTLALRKWGYEVVCAASAGEGAALLKKRDDIRLVLLDRGLPDGDGLKICRALKTDPRTRHLPVIVLTGLDELDDKLKTYKSGADIHLTKPISLPLLKRYVATFMDRIPYRGEGADALSCGMLTLLPQAKKALIGGKSIEDLPPRLFDLLYLLASKQGRDVSTRTLIQKLWGGSVRDSEVAVSISRLRQRLGPELGLLIRSNRGRGYSIDADFRPPTA